MAPDLLTLIVVALLAALAGAFAALSSEALKHNSAEFLRLAQENPKQFQIQAHHELAKKEQAVDLLVTPIKEMIEKTRVQIHEIEIEKGVRQLSEDHAQR